MFREQPHEKPWPEDGSFAGRLRYLLVKKNLTSRTLARDIGVHEASVSDYTHGDREPGLQVLAALGQRLDVSLDWLAGLTEDPTPRARLKKGGRLP